jgi:hydrogenase maturation protease
MTTPVATTGSRDGIPAEDSAVLVNQPQVVTIQIVGIGSPHGDDQVGWLVADNLTRRIASFGNRYITSRRVRSPAQILDWLDGIRRLVVVDACVGLGTPGQVIHSRWPTIAFDRLRGGGSHDFSLWQTLVVAAELKTLPPVIDVWCVEGLRFESGQPLSAGVSLAIVSAADAIWATLRES